MLTTFGQRDAYPVVEFLLDFRVNIYRGVCAIQRLEADMKVYLDVCCPCRPFDDQRFHRIRMEAEAVIAILNGCIERWELVGSEVIEYELAKIPDEERKKSVESLLHLAHERIMIDEVIMGRARAFNEIGIDAFDALHLATAESTGAVFLTPMIHSSKLL